MTPSLFDSLKKALVEPETAFEWKVFHRFWQLLAQALHSSRERVQAVLERYPDAEYDQSGNLLGWGLTLNPTVHQVGLESRSLYAWCAPDTLYDPLVVNRPAQVVSRCPLTGARIELTLTPDHLESLSPTAAVVSIIREGNMFKRLQEAGCIRQGGCNNQFFFAYERSPCSKWPWRHVREGKDGRRTVPDDEQLCLKNKGKQELKRTREDQQERLLDVKRTSGESSLLGTVQMGMHGESDERKKHEQVYR